MPVLAQRSCYVLETSVQPGGSRWAELHAYAELAEIRGCLAAFLANSDGLAAYHAIRYGMVFGIWSSSAASSSTSSTSTDSSPSTTATTRPSR